ncbi:MAG TPA: diguanylate cyclase [Candidatus Obscuribacterales bacterium]
MSSASLIELLRPAPSKVLLREVVKSMISDRYQAFFAQSTVGLGYLDFAERILEVNPALCRLSGYTATELVGMRFPHLVHPADAKAFEVGCRQLLAAKIEALRLELRLLHRAGGIHWVQSHFSPLRDEATGDRLCLVATFEDIDQRKRLETHFKQRARRDSLLVEFTQQMLRSLDLPQILQSSVAAVRAYLHADRVVVYRFESTSHLPPEAAASTSGAVIVEAVGPDLPTMLHHQFADPCFHLETCLQLYRTGQVSAVSNIYEMGYADCYIELLERYRVMGHLMVPISQDVGLWGLLVVQQCDEPRAWQADEISLVRQIAALMAIAIRQGELYAQVQQEAAHQQAINDLSRAILSGQNLESFFDLALRKLLDILQADYVVIGQHQPQSDRWLLIAEEKRSPSAPSLLGAELLLDAQHLWASEADLIPILTTALEQAKTADQLSQVDLLAIPWVVSPLVIKAGLWGALMILREPFSTHYWSPEKLDLVQLVSRQFSLAIQQNLFYKQWQSRADQQVGLHRLSNAIRDSLDLDEVFASAAQEIRSLLQIERFLIWEFNPNERLWVLRLDEHSGDELTSFVGLEVPDDHNALATALKQQTMLWFNQTPPYPAELVQILAKTFPGAWLLVPLQVSQMTWGTLHCIQKDEWQEWQRDLAVAVADKLAIAVQQSMLYAQVQAANYKLQELALIDGLTGIPNRRYFDDYLQQEWHRTLRETGCISLILCDVDFFKPYNDTYGHQAGDDALRAIAHALKTTIQRSGDVVARYGGEEFGIILPGTTSVGAARIAEGIQQTLRRLAIPHRASTVDPHITLSLGIASLHPAPHLTAHQLLKLADQALYRAKRNGRNRFCIFANPDMAIAEGLNPDQAH